jgi:hypothetical protein
MTKTEIDVMWSRALREAIEGGEEFTRYRFAAMVASAERVAEREACAKVCDSWSLRDSLAAEMAEEIRARGETK